MSNTEYLNITSDFPELNVRMQIMRSRVAVDGIPPTEFLTLAQLIYQVPSYISYVNNYQNNYALQIECIRINPECLQYIDNQTVELCLIAMDQGSHTYKYCKIVPVDVNQVPIGTKPNNKEIAVRELIKKQLLLDELSGEDNFSKIESKMTKALVEIRKYI